MNLAREYDSFFIDGEWSTPLSSDRIVVTSPTSEGVLGSVPAASFADMDNAVAAARNAYDHGPWPRTGVQERISILETVRDLLASRREDFATLITDEMGSPISQSVALQVGTPLAMLDSYIELARQFPFRDVRLHPSGSALVTREPVGVVAAIVPWNVPLTVAIQKVAPALLTGCTVVLKPAPETPLTTLALAQLFEEAGLPGGVLNVVPAEREASEYLVGHPGVDKVTFTGSTVAGRRIGSLCGQNLKRVSLELGGKSAAIILDDADLDATVEALRMGSLRNSGQICSLKTRLLVSRRLHDELIDRVRDLIDSMPVGDPHDPATQIGPMVTSRQRDIVNGYIEIGKSEGAQPVVEGGAAASAGRGWFVTPTVFSGVEPGMRIAQEEIFGPVLSVISYDDEETAIDLANDSSYGLSGAIFTSDIEKGLRVASRIRTGSLELNGNPVGLRAPVGGVKSSGVGRESGVEGLNGYVEIKSLGLPRDYASDLQSTGGGLDLSD